MDAAKRKEVLAELTSQGYSASYLNSWPPKVDLYRHKPGLNTEGIVCFPTGSMVLNQPGHPDHAARKSRLGWLPWAPSPECKCKACRERTPADWAKLNGEEEVAAVVAEAEGVMGIAAAPLHVHKYGKADDAPCRVPGCTARRLLPFRKRVAVPA